MKLTLPTALLAAGLTLFSVGYAKNNNASTQPEPAKTATLETIVSTQHSEEQITFAQHQKEIRRLVNYYIARIADRYESEYIDRQGDVKRLQVIFEDAKFKEWQTWKERSDEWVKALQEHNRVKIDKIEKENDLRSLYNPPHLEPEEYAVIKYDLEKNVFYLIREFSGQEMFYVQDIGANGLQLNTKDFVRTAKDFELPGHSFEGPAICNKEAEWKQANIELSSRYVQEVHRLVKVLENRWAGKYAFPAKK